MPNGRLIEIDPLGFVFVDGVKACRFVPGRFALQFWDKDVRRSAERGDRCVEVGVGSLVQALGVVSLPPMMKHTGGEHERD